MEEPKGIAFYNTKSDETRYAKTEPQIQAYINSSDMGINASRGQDFKWKLHPDWVHKVRDFRRDENKMSNLAARLRLPDDIAPNTMQVLYAIYGQQIRAFRGRKSEESTPFEEKYLQDIADKPQPEEVPEELEAPKPPVTSKK